MTRYSLLVCGNPLNSVMFYSTTISRVQAPTVQQMKCSIFARELLGGLRTALLIMLLDRYVVHRFIWKTKCTIASRNRQCCKLNFHLVF